MIGRILQAVKKYFTMEKEYKVLKDFMLNDSSFVPGQIVSRETIGATEVEFETLLADEYLEESVQMSGEGEIASENTTSDGVDFTFKGMKVVSPVEEMVEGAHTYKKFTVENGQVFKINVASDEAGELLDLRGGGGGKA